MKLSFIAFCIAVFLVSCNHKTSSRIDLSGNWQFAADPSDTGQKEKWYSQSLPENVVLPGSMKDNGKGDTPGLKTPWTGTIYDSSFYFNPGYDKFRKEGDVKFPFWLTPNKYYKGAAWYRKEVNIPSDWDGKRVVLHLERPHWQTRVWVNDEPVGYQNSLSTPHEFNITDVAKPGTNYITICVDNRTDSINVGPDSHSVSDHTQGNWNGIVGDMYIQSGSKVYVEDIQLYPDVKNKMVHTVISLKNISESVVEADVVLQVRLVSGESTSLPLLSEKLQLNKGTEKIEIAYAMGDDMKLWDEFNPDFYQMKVLVKDGGKVLDEKKEVFGMREVAIKEGKIIINGRAVFMRGTLECNTFPLTGYPATDEESWARIFEVCKKSGLNHIRFHSHCPPEAAFNAADKLGIYLQPEAASWPNHGTSLGGGRPTDQYVLNETERIIKAYGNHPSFVLWAYCNEPYGNYVPFLDKSLVEWKTKDPRRIYTAACIGKSWSVNPESQFIVRSVPRGLPFKKQPNAIFNYEERIADESRPYITHEMGQYCVFPDFSEIEKYTGVYKAGNFEMFRELLEEKHMGDQGHDFLMASGKLQALCYKAEIEAQLRTTTLDGFQLLGLNDFPGQGSAIIGLLNVFWEEKDYITKEAISRFCNQTVPLAELSKFVYTNQESLKCPVSVSHYGPADLDNIQPSYCITTIKGDTLVSDKLQASDIKTGMLNSIGEIEFLLTEIKKAVQCKLEISVANYTNSWDFWVYPSRQAPISEDEVYYTTNLDKKALDKLKEGGKVFLDASGKVENGKDVVANFTPVFWNTSWFKMRPPHTTGILVKEDHPVFSEFPTSYHTNYQWWEILNGRQIMCVDSFPTQLKPLVQPIDTWFLNRRLAQLFEVRVGKGKLVVSTLNLDPDNGPASAQLRQSIAKYMNSSEFNPKDEVKPETVLELFEKKERQKVNLYTVGTPDELKPKKNKSK
ncbi:exo-beta-1,4-galactosidase [Plebeiibacterium marinum]|uniref:beta-galactosidase n=1 Tax=Plebeiibacterium marinum TaxID=2992111 RepID=A0AAE3MEC1_9BACT|nr:sugar-binding domain-containing protein [Plebeiobacterium marinum]MCW3805487.1 beta-glucuronidase [Plebeiobacterium marinum]